MTDYVTGIVIFFSGASDSQSWMASMPTIVPITQVRVNSLSLATQLCSSNVLLTSY
jgi:hypothetical protein